mgnify:CR=1 FL=1
MHPTLDQIGKSHEEQLQAWCSTARENFLISKSIACHSIISMYYYYYILQLYYIHIFINVPTRNVAFSKSSTSSASSISANCRRLVSSLLTFGMRRYTIEDQALYNVSSQIEVAKHSHDNGLDNRLMSSSRSRNI